MAIKIDTREEEKKEGVKFVWFVASVFLILFFSAYTYIFISSKEIEREIIEKNSQIQSIIEGRRDIEKEIALYNRSISNFKEIFNRRKNVVRVFSVVENIAHPYVWFPSFRFTVETGEVFLSGRARDFTALGQQIMILKEVPGLEEASVSGIQPAMEGDIHFSISLKIDTKILE